MRLRAFVMGLLAMGAACAGVRHCDGCANGPDFGSVIPVMHPSSSQAREMADESMVRNLAAQAEAIWPQEEPIFDRHPIGSGSVLDVGCGTAEITERLATKYPNATFVGLDLEEQHLERARMRCAKFGPRVRFHAGDALA